MSLSLLKGFLDEISGENVFASFYEKLKQMREHYRKYPEADVRPPKPEAHRMLLSGSNQTQANIVSVSVRQSSPCS